LFERYANGGDNAKKGSTVTLSVSAGAGTKELPDFTDQLAEDAKKTLESSGFNVTLVPESHDTIRLGRVIRTEPAAGERANVGGNVTVVFSSGPPQVKIPDVANQPRQQALDTLSKDFSVQTVLEPSDTVAVDSVTRTDPPAGTDVIKTSAVKMFVSTGRDQATVPEVRGLAVDDAKAKIASARLQASTIEQTSTEGNAGKVIDQTPPSGTKVDPKSTVVLTVGAAIPTTTTTAPAVTTTTAAGP
jgi:serine/threonine-protein kinase